MGEVGHRRALEALPRGTVRHDPESATLLAPIPDPGKIICLGLNYRDHAAESNVPVPNEPVLFSKFASALIGHRSAALAWLLALRLLAGNATAGMPSTAI